VVAVSFGVSTRSQAAAEAARMGIVER
jgi:hypothetical protein